MTSPYREVPVDPREERRTILAKMICRPDVTLDDLDAAEKAIEHVLVYGPGTRKVPSKPGQHPVDWDHWWCFGCNLDGDAHWLLWHHCPPEKLAREAQFQGRAAARRRLQARDRAKWPWYRRWWWVVKEAL